MIGTQSDYAQHAGISKQAVSAQVKAGKIPRLPDGRIDFLAADKARQKNLDPTRGGAVSSGNGEGDVSLRDTKAAREILALEQDRIKHARLVGELVLARDISDAVAQSGMKIKQAQEHILLGCVEEMHALCQSGDVNALRAYLRKKLKEMQQMIVDNLNVVPMDTIK